ncbi:MAG: hypothetical protein PWR25_1819 [Euryarchaeota archaeon]|nr:hypothetical protein [Euryarchaeota archaeon]
MSGKIVASLPRTRFSPVIPPIVAVVACVIWAGTARAVSGTVGPAPPSVLPVFILVIVTLAVTGAATPLPLISGTVSIRRERQAVLAAVAAPVPFVFALLINPDRWPGGPAPLIADRVPVGGWLLDGIMGALPFAVDTTAYKLAFSALTDFGFYLECVLVATVLYAALRVVATPQKNARYRK